MREVFKSPNGTELGTKPDQLQVQFTLSFKQPDSILLPQGVAEIVRQSDPEVALGYLRGLGYLSDYEDVNQKVAGIEIVDVEKFEVWNG